VNNLKKLQLSGKTILFLDDVSRLLGLSRAAASVYCSRASKRGEILALKREMFLVADSVANLGSKELFFISNNLMTPSYVSLTTALSYYEITTQQPQSAVSAVTILPKKVIDAGPIRWTFFQLKKNFYFGFKKIEEVFIAEPEKAIVDIALLVSFGRYAVDLSAIDFKKFDWKKVEKYGRRFPGRTQALIKKWRKSYA
jgi:predicted transcriptional regulator of viral defense system